MIEVLQISLKTLEKLDIEKLWRSPNVQASIFEVVKQLEFQIEVVKQWNCHLIHPKKVSEGWFVFMQNQVSKSIVVNSPN